MEIPEAFCVWARCRARGDVQVLSTHSSFQWVEKDVQIQKIPLDNVERRCGTHVCTHVKSWSYRDFMFEGSRRKCLILTNRPQHLVVGHVNTISACILGVRKLLYVWAHKYIQTTSFSGVFSKRSTDYEQRPQIANPTKPRRWSGLRENLLPHEGLGLFILREIGGVDHKRSWMTILRSRRGGGSG